MIQLDTSQTACQFRRPQITRLDRWIVGSSPHRASEEKSGAIHKVVAFRRGKWLSIGYGKVMIRQWIQ